MAWSHINRFLLVNYRWLSAGWSFKRYMQNHSQPINPRWARDGEFCRMGGKYYARKECGESLLKRRDKFQKGNVPASMMKLAQEFADGQHPSPFTEPTYDFAACSLVRKQHRPNTGLEIGGNCHLFYSSLKPNERKAVVAGEVTLDTAVTSEKVSYAGLIVVGALVAYGLYKLISER